MAEWLVIALAFVFGVAGALLAEHGRQMLQLAHQRIHRICDNCRFPIEPDLPHYPRGRGSCSTAPTATCAPGGPYVRTLYHEHLNQKGA